MKIKHNDISTTIVKQLELNKSPHKSMVTYINFERVSKIVEISDYYRYCTMCCSYHLINHGVMLACIRIPSLMLSLTTVTAACSIFDKYNSKDELSLPCLFMVPFLPDSSLYTFLEYYISIIDKDSNNIDFIYSIIVELVVRGKNIPSYIDIELLFNYNKEKQRLVDIHNKLLSVSTCYA